MIYETVRQAFQNIWSNKFRTFLTMLGIIIGVASVVIMVSVVQGQNRQTMEMFEKLGDNKITVQPTATTTPTMRPPRSCTITA